MNNTEYIIWGFPPGANEEQLLYTKAKTRKQADKVIKILLDGHGVSSARIQVLDLTVNPVNDWNSKKIINNTKDTE
jgi:hypothetical protein